MDFLDCKICHVPYDEEDHRPRHAPCGHELCSACIQALIKDVIFECPKCRQKNKVYVPDDLPVNFGLIDVIRAFKTKSISVIHETELKTSGAKNDEICKAHRKAIGHRCIKCEIWICDECLDSHSPITGCSTVNSYTAVQSMKDNCTKGIEMVLTAFDEDASAMSTKIQEHTDQRNKHLKLAEKHDEDMKKIRNLLEQGESRKESLVKSQNQLSATNSPYAVMDSIEMATQMKQSLYSWTVNNLGTDTSGKLTQLKQPLYSLSVKNIGVDNSSSLPKALKEGKDIYVDMIFKGEKRHGKLSQYEEITYFHSIHKQAVPDGSICLPFDRVQKMIPKDTSLVFLELSLGGVVKGRVLMRLNKDLPNIREHVVQLVTGQTGQSLLEVEMWNKGEDHMVTKLFGSKEFTVTPDRPVSSTAIRGTVLGYFDHGYLSNIYFYVSNGTIEEGLEIILECHNEFHSNVKISDCGLVMEHK